MTPKLLLIETSGAVGQVGLTHGSVIVGRRELDRVRRHARDLAPSVADLLREQAWRPRDITALFVSQGPGSYTGLRVGIMSAKAFAYAAGSSLLGVETMAVIAAAITSDRAVTVIEDAQQEKVYSQVFQCAAGSVKPEAQSPLRIVQLSEWLEQLRPGSLVCGPGLRVYRERLPAHAEAAPEEFWHPRLESLLRLGLLRFNQGERDDLWKFEPLYHRASSAEEKWAEKRS